MFLYVFKLLKPAPLDRAGVVVDYKYKCGKPNKKAVTPNWQARATVDTPNTDVAFLACMVIIPLARKRCKNQKKGNYYEHGRCKTRNPAQSEDNRLFRKK